MLDSPLHYTNNNAPQPVDVLGTLPLSILSVHWRYSPISILPCYRVNPELLGMSKIGSPDSARRAFFKTCPNACRDWLHSPLEKSGSPLLEVPWITDRDTGVRVLHGWQEGAVRGYNPRKPGRPSHVQPTYVMANTPLVLDVEIHPGNETATWYTRPRLWALIDSLPRKQWPQFLRGDWAFGNARDMTVAEERDLEYLFKLRHTGGVKGLIEQVFKGRPWSDVPPKVGKGRNRNYVFTVAAVRAMKLSCVVVFVNQSVTERSVTVDPNGVSLCEGLRSGWTL